jgi:dihydropyrimidinase
MSYLNVDHRSPVFSVKREPFAAVNKALSTWKEITAPRKVQRTGIPASGV